MLPPAVVLSGHLMALGVVRSLGYRGVRSIVLHYRPETDLAHESRYAWRSLRVPHPEREEDDFVEALRTLGPKVAGSPLIPASDETLGVVARHRDELSRWYRIAAPAGEIVDRILRKEHTYALADAIGVAAPRTHLATSMADIEKQVQKFGYPCLIKPSQSHRYVEVFGRKMVRADNIGELRAAYREAAAEGLEVLLQELIPGDDRHGVNYNSYRRDGRPLVEFTAQKVRLTPRHFGPPSVVVSRLVPEVLEPGRLLLQALGYEGFSCVEFKRDARNGRYVLMEVNGRFNLSSLLAERCGINFPWISYSDLVFGSFEDVPRQRTGIYWIDGTKDLVHAVPDLARVRMSVGDLLEPYRRPHVFAAWSRSDPRPFVHRLWLLASAVAAHARHLSPLASTNDHSARR